jgi:peptidyl-prolyl cis-trans isomerase B (cyclophilin B)
VSSSKRARAYARRRQDEWAERRRLRLAAQRRRRIVGATVVGVLVVTTAASAVVLATRDDPPAPAATPSTAAYDGPPPAAEAEGRAWPVVIETSVGDVAVELDGAAAPQAVASFLMLARDGYFDGSTCHRLVVGELLQCGDPTGSGGGGPGYTFGPVENTPEDMTYAAGTVAMARRANDASSQGSQFFITTGDVVLPEDSAGGYTVFGRVTSGLELLTQVDAGGTVDGGPDGRPAVDVTIEGVVIP